MIQIYLNVCLHYPKGTKWVIENPYSELCSVSNIMNLLDVVLRFSDIIFQNYPRLPYDTLRFFLIHSVTKLVTRMWEEITLVIISALCSMLQNQADVKTLKLSNLTNHKILGKYFGFLSIYQKMKKFEGQPLSYSSFGDFSSRNIFLGDLVASSTFPLLMAFRYSQA